MQKDLKLIINLHRSPLLADAVASILGANDCGEIEFTKKRMKEQGQDRAISVRYGLIGGNDAWENYRTSGHFTDHTFLDAATEFGKLVALLEKPEPKVIKDIARATNHSGATHSGEVKEDGSGIVVGCSFVPRAKVKEAYEALFGEVK